MKAMTPKFAIGTKYTPRGKDYQATVVDILKTYNSAGELVRIRYVSTHTFLGQTVTDQDVIETTIARGNPE
jgi:hypothetical protein